MGRKWSWLIAGLVVVALARSNPGFRNYWHKKRHHTNLLRKLEEIRAQNKSLALEIQRLKTDPKIIGEYARKELGMILPGEIEYRFVVDGSTP